MRFKNYAIALSLLFISLYPVSINWHRASLMIEAHINLLIAAAALAGLIAFKPSRRILHYIGAAEKHLDRVPDKWLLMGASLCFIVLTCFISAYLFQRLPHNYDSQSQYIQSKIFASGQFYWPAGDISDFFGIQQMVIHNRVYTIFPPGHSMLLALLQLLGAPWLLGSLMGALFIVATYYLCLEFGNKAAARLTIYLAMLSPFILLMSSEYMNHTTALLLVTCFLLFFVRGLKTRRLKPFVLAGVTLGCLMITRPQVALALSLFFIPFCAFYFGVNWKYYGARYAILLVPAILISGIYVFFNFKVSDQLLLTDQDNAAYIYEFHNTNWLIYGNRAAVESMLGRAGKQFGSFNIELMGWPFAILPICALYYLYNPRRRGAILLGGAFIAACLWLSITYPYSWAYMFGPRYLYEANGAVIVMLALAFHKFAPFLRKACGIRISSAEWRGALISLFYVASVMGLLNASTVIYRTLFDSTQYGNKLLIYNSMQQTLTRPSLVFVSKDELQYMAFTLPPDKSSKIIFARDLEERNGELMRYYPDRDVYQVSRGEDGEPNIKRLR